MNKAIFYRVGAIIIIVSGILTALVSSTEMPNDKNNGFEREWGSSDPEEYFEDIRIIEPMKRIVGVSDQMIYLSGDTPNGVLILSKDGKYKDTLLLNYQIPPEKMVPFNIIVDSPRIYWHLNNLQRIISGHFPNEPLVSKIIKGGIFLKSIQISPTSIVIKTFDSTMTHQVFRKVDIESGETIGESAIVDNAKDGVLGVTTEGTMIWSNGSARILYVEYYTNKVYCIDSNLKLIYKTTTIDTSKTVQIELTEEHQSDSTIQLAPSKARIVVNKDCFADDDYLYIVSGLRSDDQNVVDYNRVVTIDRYKISTGEYVNSLKYPKIDNKAFNSVVITHDTLIALYEKNLLMYRLPE